MHTTTLALAGARGKISPRHRNGRYFFATGGRSGRVEFGEFSDFFETLFERSESGFSDAHSDEMPGEDALLIVEVGVEEACAGGAWALRVETGPVQYRNLDVKIPAGVTEGQRIRIAGQGRPGPGGRCGELLLVVRLLPHALFSVSGRDVHLRLPVTPWEAALGATIEGTDANRACGYESASRLRHRSQVTLAWARTGAQSGR
jgi:DnaJ-class molecular chaperone